MMQEGSLRSLTAVRTVSLDFNPADYLSQESWSETIQTKPLSVGRFVKHPVDFAEAAQLVGTVEERNIYRLQIELEGTPVGSNLYYDDFYIPEGGKLYIYSPEGKQVLGAYTRATHPEHGAFATEPISGNTLILDYEAPISGEMPSIKVQGVGYFYRPVLMADKGAGHHINSEDASDPGFARYCQVNANCPEGDSYQAQKASSVALLMIKSNGGIGFCSGNLVNNVAGDFKPYITTAAHCASITEDFAVSPMELSQWIFAFHYEKPRCSSGDYATTHEMSMVGAEMKSFLPMKGYSDGLLLELTNEIPLNYRVYYSGWDASTMTWPRGASIHHPAGDAAKISIFDGGVSLTTWSLGGGENDHFGFHFTKGHTEQGSSGSPLFNAEGNQIGTLTGGSVAPCSMDANYGRMNSHFDKYKSKGNTWYMAKWLDPKNSGTTKVKGTWRENYQPLAVVPSIIAKIEPTDATKVKISWKPVAKHPQGYEVKYNLYRNGRRIASQAETTYEDLVSGDMKRKGRVSYSVEAVYTVDGKEETTPAAYYTLYTGKLAARAPHTVSEGKTGAKIKWQMPYNTQIVSKIKNRDKVAPLKAANGVDYILKHYTITKDDIRRIYMYDSYRLGQSPLNGQKLYIHQVNFIPSQDTPYKPNGSIDSEKNLSFFIRQKVDGRPIQYYGLIIPQGTADKKQFFSMQLSMPYEISDAHLLDVGFAFDPSNITGDIYVDANSTDENINYDGCKLALDLRDEYKVNKFTLWPVPYSSNRMAYQAVELVVSNNPRRQPGVTNEYYTRGELPVPFPEIKGYAVYRNGQKITNDLLPADTYVYEDANGKTSDDYYVEVVYDYPGELRPNEPIHVAAAEVSLYPAHFTTQLQLTDATDVLAVELYSMEGIQVAAFAGAQLTAMDVTSLPAGQYIATIRTADGVKTQRLVK